MLADLIPRRMSDRALSSPGQMSWPDYLKLWEQFGYNNVNYMVPIGAMQSLTAMQAMRNPIVQAAIVLRAACLSEVRFAFQRKVAGKSGRGDLYGAPSLDLLDRPWTGAEVGELPMRLEFDATLYGNSYWTVANGELVWLDPTKMKIVTADVVNQDGEIVGKRLVGYQLQGKSGQPEASFMPSEVVHYKPIPDPMYPFRGLSWLSSLLPDIVADQDMTTYKHSFLNNAATPNIAVVFNQNIGQDAFNQFRDKMESNHVGPAQGFKTLYLGAGADVKTIGSNFSDLNLADNQAYGETRISVASGVPASLLGIAEGMKGATLNTANYAATRRRFSDMVIRPLWRKMCSSLETAVKPPTGSRLWYDDRDIVFLMADMQDQASVRASDAVTIVNLTNAGYTPDSIMSAVISGDWSQLVHSGFMSIQLQPITPPGPAPAGDAQDGGDANDTSGDAQAA